MNTYFNYQAEIRSLDLSRAISFPKGIGPFTGFGSGKISTSDDNTNQGGLASFKITLYPEYYSEKNAPTIEGLLPNYSFLQPLIRDIKTHHELITTEKVLSNNTTTIDTSNDNVTFGLITRDGFICTNNISSWSIPISNYQGTSAPKEVVVLARHSYVSEAVDNPVTLEAYATNYGIVTNSSISTGDSEYQDLNSFYDLYRRSMDIYYNQSETSDFSSNNPLSSENSLGLKLSYYDLLGYVQAKLTQITDWTDLTLVGIYGTGTYTSSDNTSTNEYFSIVPYEGKWPMDLPFNTAVMNGITKDLYRLSSVQEGFPVTVDDDSMNILQYLEYRLQVITESLTSQTDSIIPSGLICLWDQEEVPDGWHEYTAAQGRVVIGFNSGGILAGSNGSTILDTIGSSYPSSNIQASDWQIQISSEDLPKHFHAIAMGTTSWTGEGNNMDDPVVSDWSNYNSSLVDGAGSSDTKTINAWSNVGMKNGAIKTGPNLTTTDSGTAVSSSTQVQTETLSLQKILPSITLMYIQKD